VEVGLGLAVTLAFAFAFTNGVQDAANSIATLVATRAARPARALVLATVCVLVGPLLIGSAVAATMAGLVNVEPSDAVEVAVAALGAALVWNLAAWYRGLPSSSTHALVGGLVGAAVAAGGIDAVNWGGRDGWQPEGVAAVLFALAVSPFLGAWAALLVLRGLRRLLRRATRSVVEPIARAQWLTSGLLSLGQGANDAQKTVGVIATVSLAEGLTSTAEAPTWVVAGAALSLAAGTALGGWRIVRTIGQRIYELRSLDALASQTGSAAVVVGASLAGAPVSTTHVVASSVVGAGGGRRRWGRIRWAVVTEMGVAWVTTLPATALLAAVAFSVWRWLA
jgi:PiT family inorganic phosphate transporter